MLLTTVFSRPQAYVPAESTQRVPIRWSLSQIPIILQHNPKDVTATKSTNITSEVLSQWNAVSGKQIVGSSYGSNTMSYSEDTRYFGPGVVAVTVLSYDPAVGRVSNGQIYVNQTTTRGFCLTADKPGSVCTTPGASSLPRIYLGDVLAHEFGHLLGLGHSEVRDSTMLFTTFKGQHTPHADDISGVRKIYGASLGGKISGTLKGGNGVGIFGGHVQAISIKSGTIAAGAISQEDGSFTIVGLELDDTYYLYVEPLRYLAAMPDAYRSVKNDFCPGEYVGSFFETCGNSARGHPQPIALSTGQPNINVGTVSIRCQLRVGENYLQTKLSSGGGTYEFTASPQSPVQAFVGLYAATDVLPTSSYSTTQVDTINLDLTQLSLPSTGAVSLDIRLVTTSLGSPLDFSVEIDGPSGSYLDPDRARVSGEPVLNVDASTLRPQYERQLSYPLSLTPALNTVTIRLQPRALSLTEMAYEMPLESIFGLDERPWLLWVSVLRNGEVYYQHQVAGLNDNLSCLDAAYAFSVRANPVSAAGLAGQDDAAATSASAATCGSWQPPPPGGPGSGAFMGWGLLFGLILGIFIIKPRLS